MFATAGDQIRPKVVVWAELSARSAPVVKVPEQAGRGSSPPMSSPSWRSGVSDDGSSQYHPVLRTANVALPSRCGEASVSVVPSHLGMISTSNSTLGPVHDDLRGDCEEAGQDDWRSRIQIRMFNIPDQPAWLFRHS